MKKLVVLIMALVMTLSLAACGGSAPASASSPTPAPSSTPAQSPSSQSKEAEFTAEQQALAQEFMDMAEAFDKTVDRVNASPEALKDEALIKTMNELADEIIAADDYFAKPETLTPEVMEGLKAAIEATHKFISAAEAALDQVEGAKADSSANSIVVPVEIFNLTGVDIYALALSPANDSNWGENLITEVIKNGEKVAGELVFTADTLVWDILVQDKEENQLTFMGVDFTEANIEGAKLVLEATEGGKYIASVN